VKSKNKELVIDTLNIVAGIRDTYSKNGLLAAVQFTIHKTNVIEYFENLHKNDRDKYEERYMNIMAVVDVSRAFRNDTLQDELQLDDLEAFLSSADLQINASKKDNEDSVSMMTIHTSKGLEYKYVFLVGADQGVFPSFRAIDENQLEEERRLAYVAITRAMKNLFITTSKTRMDRATAGLSEFIRDVDDEWKIYTKAKKTWF
jgi:DNA helicase-2/ATP-dependent DNA helicase PcrA